MTQAASACVFSLPGGRDTLENESTGLLHCSHPQLWDRTPPGDFISTTTQKFVRSYCMRSYIGIIIAVTYHLFHIFLLIAVMTSPITVRSLLFSEEGNTSRVLTANDVTGTRVMSVWRGDVSQLTKIEARNNNSLLLFENTTEMSIRNITGDFIQTWDASPFSLLLFYSFYLTASFFTFVFLTRGRITGHFSLLQLMFGGMELVWHMRHGKSFFTVFLWLVKISSYFPYPWVIFLKQYPNGEVTLYAYNWSETGISQMKLTPGEYILPFAATVETFASYTTATLLVILIGCLALNLQRVLDAIVGVREFAVADGHCRCPLCGEEWELLEGLRNYDEEDDKPNAIIGTKLGTVMMSLFASHQISGHHRCPKLFIDRNTGVTVSGTTVDHPVNSYHLNVDDDRGTADEDLQSVNGSASLGTVIRQRQDWRKLREPCGIAGPRSYGTLEVVEHIEGRVLCDSFTIRGDRFRPGNAFSSFDDAGWIGRATYSWLNPLMSFGLIDREVLHHERFFPSLPSGFTSLQNIATPAWQLWVNRWQWFRTAQKLDDDVGIEETDDSGDNVSTDKRYVKTGQRHLLTGVRFSQRRPKRSRVENLVWFLTVPIRYVLCKAVVYIFIGEGRETHLMEGKQGGIDESERPSLLPNTAVKSRPRLALPDMGLFIPFFEHRSGRRFAFFCMPLRLASDVLSLAIPTLVYRLILLIEEGASKDVSTVIGVCSVLFFILLGRALLHQEYISQLYLSALEAGTAIRALVLEKTLALPLAQRNFTDGEVIHLATVDALRCSQTLMHLHQLWRCPCFVAASLYVLHMHIGIIPTLVSLVIIIFAIPFQRVAGREVQAAQQRCTMRTVDRVELVGEAVTSMRQVKAMGAEDMYLRRIHTARQEETRNEVGVMEALTNSACLTEGMGVLLTSACYTAYYLSGGPLTARVVVPALVALNLLRGAIEECPTLVAAIPRGYASLRRIETYLQQAPDKFLGTRVDMTVDCSRNCGTVLCRGSSFTWQPDNTHEAPRPVLRDVHMFVRPGEIVIVQGPVGSGKTTLLLAMLGEVNLCCKSAVTRATTADSYDATSSLELQSPNQFVAMSPVTSPIKCGDSANVQQSTDGFLIFGRSAYCNETPWLQNDTIRANIILDNVYNASWYQTVTVACALHEDFEALAKGDASVVGARGVQLSSGQRVRVALARALYSRADVYVLDNILVSLDSRLQAHIIEQVFYGILRHRTVILATYVCHPMLKPNRLFALHSDGTVVEKSSQQLSSLRTAGWEEPVVVRESGADSEGTYQVDDRKDDCINHRNTAHGLGRSELGQSSVYICCFLSFMGPSLLWVVVSSVAQHVLQVGRDVWLSIWIATKPIGSVGFLLCYFLIGTFAALCIIPRMRLFFHAVRTSINHIHFLAIERMFRAPASYFDANAGNIITGIFSRDQETADHSLLESLDAITTGVLRTLAIVFFNAVVNPWFLLIIPLTAMVFYHVVKLYLIVAANVRRLENRSVRGSVSILREVLEGAPIVRCMGLDDIIRDEYCRAMDVTNTVSMIGHMADCWVSLRLEFITVLMTTTAALFGTLFVSYRIPPAFVAVAMVCCLQTSNTLLLLCRNVSVFQLRFLSVEQLIKLHQAPEEPLRMLSTTQGSSSTREMNRASESLTGQSSPKLLTTAQQRIMMISEARGTGVWPAVIELVNVSAKYSESLPYVLRNVSLTIYEKERVGIVGPSGNGKSTLFNVLLRLVDVIEGDGVYLRGMNTGFIPYPDLRQSFMLILQDPLVIKGTWRTNLLVGTKGYVTDETLWAALRTVGLEAVVAQHGGLEGRLQHEGTGGVRLSPGQRQLLWLARAVLWKPQFFLFDELPDTSAIETRSAIRHVLANELRDCTALFIAHSVDTLETLCTRVVVINNGTVLQDFELGDDNKERSAIKKSLQSIVE